MDQKYFDHFFPDPKVFGESPNYKASGGGSSSRIPERDRQYHADRLIGEYRQVLKLADENRQIRLEQSLPVMDGIQLEFVSKEGTRLVFAGLEGRSEGVYLLNERLVKPEDAPPFEAAIVHLPIQKGSPNAYFADRIKKYRDENNKDGNPHYDKLIRSIESIRLADLNSFWFGMDIGPPDDKTEIWCEVWLNRPDEPRKKKNKRRIKTNSTETGETSADDPSDVVARFRRICDRLSIEYRSTVLVFPEQEILLVRANGIQLQGLVDSVEMLSSICPYREPATFFLDMPVREQPEWIENTLSRLNVRSNPTCSVCVLDTGVNNAHPLLAPVIPDGHCHSVNMDEDVADFRNAGKAHGTEMCGVVAFGDLSDAMAETHPLIVDHAVESVKILFEDKENPDELFGQITDRAVSLIEMERPELKRVACLAVTAEGHIDGTPSSWSASIDQLAFGDELENDPDLESSEEELPSHKRLFVISAGNLDNPDDWVNYPDSNITAAIQDPAQAWNALTVGAYTDKAEITELGTEGYTPVASAGTLSPVSRTSFLWDSRWPLKPDIVLEGGNAARSPQGLISDFESLAVLTTAPDWAGERGNHFAPFRGTSPATAQASWMAANIYAECPQAWPETVRGLLVHSARWTEAMLENKTFRNKDAVRELLQTVGYGVPNYRRALKSVRNSLTMIFQDDSMQPCVKDKSQLRLNHIRLFDLPWPREILRELGDIEAEIRITLSYFIAPSPGRKGWGNRYRYPSYGLRFDLNNVNENLATFQERMNARDDNENDSENTIKNDSGSERWMVGSDLRHRGSIHTDIWRTTAVNMFDTRYIAVYPTGGWWKDRPQFGHGERNVRFSLLVSVEVPDTASIEGVPVDLYSSVQQEIETRIRTKISSETPIIVSFD